MRCVAKTEPQSFCEGVVAVSSVAVAADVVETITKGNGSGRGLRQAGFSKTYWFGTIK